MTGSHPNSQSRRCPASRRGKFVFLLLFVPLFLFFSFSLRLHSCVGLGLIWGHSKVNTCVVLINHVCPTT